MRCLGNQYGGADRYSNADPDPSGGENGDASVAATHDIEMMISELNKLDDIISKK